MAHTIDENDLDGDSTAKDDVLVVPRSAERTLFSKCPSYVWLSI